MAVAKENKLVRGKDLYYVGQRIKENFAAKEDGKGLSTNDYTTDEKTKLAGIESGAQKNVKPDWNAASGDAQILNKPSIPTKTSDLTNDSGFITSGDIPEGVQPATANPKMDGAADIGSSAKYAKEDHVHPSDSSKADKATTLSGYGITNAYTKAEVDTAISNKQDTISDLASIRSGAAAGATAVQPAALNAKQDTIADLTAIRSGAALGSTSVQPVDIKDMVKAEPIGSIIPPVNPSEFATKEEVSQLGQKVDGKADLTSLLVSGQYYSTNTIGAVPTQGSNASWRSCIIPVIKGEQYKIVGQGGDSPRLWAFAGSDSKVTSCCATSGRVITENITAPEDGYLYVNLYKVHAGDGIWRTLGGLQADIQVLKSEIDAANLEAITDGINILSGEDLTLYQDNAFINSSGVLSASASGKILSYSAQKGDYIFVLTTLSSGSSILSKDSEMTDFDSLLIGGASNNEYRYIVPKDGIIYISINKAYTNRVLIIRNEQYLALLNVEKPSYINIVDFVSKSKAYVRYSDGALVTTSSPIYAYQIPLTGIRKIKVYVTGVDNIPAAIAFYSSDVITSDNYLGGVQAVANTGGGRWYEAEVPSGAITAIVTNHQGYVANPYILVDYVSKNLLGLGDGEEGMPELGIGIVFGYQKADNYDGIFNPIYTNNSYFPIESFQSRIRLTPLYGIRLNIKQAGTLTIVKATGVLTENCVMTTIKTFTTTKTGWQVLLFDAPVTLSESESLGIGVKTDTAKVVADSVYGGVNAVITNYLHYTKNVWTRYQQNLLIDVLGIPKNDAGEALTKAQSLEKRDVFAGNNPFRFNGPFYAHLFLDKIYETSTDIIIPSESLDDIRVSRRLGFNVIEANVHATSDGKFVVIHGASGRFGYEVTDLNGEFTYADTAINSVTLDWIKANIRYRSDIPRFRTTVPTFEEFLRECRLQGMIPFAQASTADMVALLDGIMGYGNYFAYNGIRALTTAPIVEYLSLTTKEAILERARSIGVPYVYAMGNYNAFTDDELKDIVSSLHSEGFMIATAYVSGANADRVRKLGFDMIASTINVNNFDNANLCTLCVGTDWSDFQITGSSATDAGVELGEGDSITPANALGTEFLAKCTLQVTFVGKLGAICGRDSAELTSDGTHPLVLSSYVINSVPTFRIYGFADSATITDIVFKASKC